MQQALTLPASGAIELSTTVAPPRVPVQQFVLLTADSNPDPASTVIGIAEIAGYLRKRWITGLLIALPLAALTFGWLGLGKKVYESEARLLLRIQDTNVFNFNEMARPSVTEVSAPMLVNNHRSELKARSYLNYLYNRLSEAERIAFLKDGADEVSWLDTATRWLGFSQPVKAADPLEAFAKKLGEATRVEPLKDSHILRVQIRAGDPVLAANFANRYVEDYIRYVAEQELSTTKASSEFLEQKSGEIRERLQESEQKLAAYRQSQGLLQDNEIKDVSSDKVRLLTASIAEAQVRLSRTREDMRMIQSAQAAGRDPLDLKLVAENSDVVAIRKLLEAKIAERAPIETWAAKHHPKMVAINQEIETYRETLKRNIAAVIMMVQTDAATIARQIEDLERQFDDARQDVLAQGGKNIQGNLLRDKVASDRELYQKVIVRMNQAEITGEFKESGLLRIADVAVAPEKPLKPSKPIALLASMLVFGFCFLGVPVGLGFCEQQVLPLLRGPAAKTPGTEDAAPDAGGEATAVERPNLSARTTVLARLPKLRDAAPGTLLGEMLRPGTPASDSMRDLVASLDQRGIFRKGPGVILVASAEPGEGKSAISAALAANLCSQGRRVFMLECNPEAPTFNLLFPHHVSHETKTTDEFESLRYGTSNLYLLPSADTRHYEQSDLLENYRSWIEKARPEVDWIILDGPSVMRNFTDIAPLLPLATDVLLVHDESHNGLENSAAALNLLRPRLAETTFCGVVVNRAA